MPQDREAPLSLKTILWLQTTIGNRAVQRLLESRAAPKAAEQQPPPVPAEAPQPEILPEPPPTADLEHRIWWWRILLWLWKRRRR